MIITALLTLLLPGHALAQEATIQTTDEILGLLGKAVVEDATQASDRVRRAREVLNEVLKTGTAEEQQQAAQEMNQARQEYQKAEKNLDTARINAIAEKSGRSPEDIQAMRQSGMGWGAIAKETGIHASVNGKGQGQGQGQARGKNKSYTDDDGDTLGNSADKDSDNTKGNGNKKSKDKGKGKGKK
jgi:hypothetical protein